jgi:hypothetical protein
MADGSFLRASLRFGTLELFEKHDSMFQNPLVLEPSIRRRPWKTRSFRAGHAPKLLEFAISPKVTKLVIRGQGEG